MTAYPAIVRERTRWILEKRGSKNTLDPMRPYAFLWEEETGPHGGEAPPPQFWGAGRELEAGAFPALVPQTWGGGASSHNSCGHPLGIPIPTATVFLTNRECPYRCLMCDLWQNTLDTRVPAGAIAAQIRYALERLPAARQIKLYNAGSFFDPQAIPPEDYTEIAETVRDFERVVVECHPALIGDRCLRFQDLLAGKLEVAVGLETVHPDVLARLNKRFTVADFQAAAAFLADHDIALRVFLLLRPPFLTEADGILWAKRSLDTAFAAGASVCCVIPTRAGNGAMEALTASGDYAPPTLFSLEAVQEYGLNLGQGRVFADLWDIERFFTCACSPERAARLAEMNRTQKVQAGIDCAICG